MSLLYDWLQAAVAERGSTSAHALVHRDTYLSWRGLLHRVDRRAQDLRGLGIARGSWIGTMLGNVPELVILGLAASKLGAVFVPLDPTTPEGDLDLIMTAAPLRALVTRPRTPGTPAPTKVVVEETRRRLPGTLLSCSLFRREPIDLSLLPAAVLFTLDSGGDPKGVVRGDAELEAIASSLRQTLSLKPRDRILCPVPMHRGYGFDIGILGWLAGRTTLILDEEAEIPGIARALRTGDVDLLPADPALCVALARLPATRTTADRPARVLSAGSALPPSVVEPFAERYGTSITSCYHATEAGPVSLDRAGLAPATVGKPFAGVELEVATADRRPLPRGTAGPIWVRAGGVTRTVVPPLPLRGSHVPAGRVSNDGWLRTGDLGFVDRHGRLTLTAREDDLVKVEGRRVALGEIERCLEGVARVREAQARLVSDEFGVTQLVARVVGRVAAAELLEHCTRNLAPHKVPRKIEIVERLG